MKHFEVSPTNLLSARADALKRQGVPIVHFGVGDPLLENHPAILRAVQKGLEQKVSPYAPVAGLEELREEAAHWMNRRYGSSFGKANCLITCGGKFALFAALQTVIEEASDEVLIVAPYWPSYPQMIRFCGGVFKVIQAKEERDWKISASDLKQNLTPKSRALLLNNPCNPTGALYSREELRELLQVAREANLIVIADEVYSEMVYEAPFTSCASFPEFRERVIVIESCSKNFAMAGWRVGFAFASKERIEAMIAIQSQTTTGTSLLSQMAALGALRESEAVAKSVKSAMQKRRDLFISTYNRLFSSQEKAPPAALYFFMKMGPNSLKVCEEILEKAHVALIPGIVFGTEGYARIAFSGSEEEIVKGLEGIYHLLK